MVSNMKMKCTIIENEHIWLRFASTEQSVDKFNQIRLFIKNKTWGKYHRHICVRVPFLEFYIDLNPFEPQTVISIGRRFFNYHWFQIKYEKSIARL